MKNDHPYVLSDLVKKEDLDWNKINLDVLNMQIIDEMTHISHARSSERAMPTGSNILQDLFYKHWKHISDDVRKAILDVDNKDSDIAKAFLMGKIAMAQHYSAEIITKLPVERAYEMMDDIANAQYFDLLVDGSEISIKQIAEQCDQDEETVRVVFRELVELGLADFRSNGKEWCYFMTRFAQNYHKKS